MKHLLIAIIKTAFFSQVVQVSAISQPSTRKLVWQDEFDTPGRPDSTKWGFDTGTGCPQLCGWGNQELQFYTDRPENIIIENGILKIKAFKENYNQASFTSARIKTKGKFSVTYGRIEVRAKVPEGIGTWPAIWMLGNNADQVGWPDCGEIDIMEHKGADLNKIYATIHYRGHSGGKANGHFLQTEDASDRFYVYALEWTENTIRILLEDTLIHEVNNIPEIPFHHNFFLILNLAMGGTFGGAIDPKFEEATFEIDYVRVYK